MIARIWQGMTDAADSDDYLEYLRRTGVRDYRATPGNRGVYVLRRLEGGRSHFLLLSLWESNEAIRRFAGDDVERAKYYPEDERFLLALEPHVEHYEISDGAINNKERKMSELDGMIDEMKQIHDGNAWHGPALRESLAGLSSQQAAERPIASAHSIWEIVRHITVWEKVFRRRLEGEPASEPEEGDFPQPGKINDELWAKTLAELDTEHEKLLNVVRNLDDAELERKIVNRDYSVRFQLHAIVRHHVYHAGQIALLRKSFSSWKDSSN